MKILQLNDLMPIGKFKGYPIKMLLGLSDDERFEGIGREKYLQWFNENVENYSFSDEIKTLLCSRADLLSTKHNLKKKNKKNFSVRTLILNIYI